MEQAADIAQVRKGEEGFKVSRRPVYYMMQISNA
jgi:hypothetical protein